MTPDDLLPVGQIGVVSSTTTALLNAELDGAIAHGTWALEMWHGCDGLAWEPPPCAVYDQHCAYVGSRSDEVWCASFQQATKYIYERTDASIDVTSVEESHITVSLTDNLDDAIFDYPLTLRTVVPDSWLDVLVRQDDRTQNVTPQDESGTRCIYYDAVPDRGEITIQHKGEPVAARALGQAQGRRLSAAWDTGRLRLDLPAECGNNCTVRLYDCRGRVVYSRTVRRATKAEIPLRAAGIRPGTYVVTAEAAGTSLVRRVTVR
jgi:hypothetical protein